MQPTPLHATSKDPDRGTPARVTRAPPSDATRRRDRATAKRVVETFLESFLEKAEAATAEQRINGDLTKSSALPRLIGHLDVDEALFERWQALRP